VTRPAERLDRCDRRFDLIERDLETTKLLLDVLTITHFSTLLGIVLLLA
jgi:hypothetical protein